MDDKEINTIIEEHGRYLLRLDGGKKAVFEPNVLSGANLRDVAFGNAVLIDAVFHFADLRGANLRRAKIYQRTADAAALTQKQRKSLIIIEEKD